METEEAVFAKGMYASLWPKVERCHSYVSILLASQAQLQTTVNSLLTGASPHSTWSHFQELILHMTAITH